MLFEGLVSAAVCVENTHSTTKQKSVSKNWTNFDLVNHIQNYDFFFLLMYPKFLITLSNLLIAGGATNEDKFISSPTPKLAQCFSGTTCPIGCIKKCAGLGLGQPGHCQGNQCCCAAI